MLNYQPIVEGYEEEFEPDMQARLDNWAARKLDVPVGQIEKLLVEVTGGCSFGTCEFTSARVEVRLTDGRIFQGDSSFGDFISNIVEHDIQPGGTVRSTARDPWKLEEVK